MEEKKPVERRKYMRLAIGSKVNFRVVKEKKKEGAPKEKVPALSRNMSVEGICFRADRDVASGAEVELEIFLPSEPEPLLLEGEIKWSQPVLTKEGEKMFNIGVRLSTFAKNDESRYMRYVCEKMTERLSRYLHL
ncbi:unnamed protein product [marine sediment metagenome]|uniref:PilZ domain-containing protein n=1 Tax=marine sediment metagenome TaxID=412755 RepID=X0TIA4_9ZZZZ